MISSLNPPVPPVATAENDGDLSSSNQKDDAHRLLRLIRLVEKEQPGDTYERYMEETVELMISLIEVYSRRGLLQGNVAKAEKILSSTSQGKTGSHGRKKGASKKNLNDSLDQNGTGEIATSDSAQVSETLIFTSLTRIWTESDEARQGREDDSSLLLALGAEMCVSVARHIQVNKDLDHVCTLAEYEVLALSAKSILSGLVVRVQSLEKETRKHSSQQGGLSAKSLERCRAMTTCLDENQHIAPVLSSLRAACALVKLFGTKLSRSTTVLSDLRKVAWDFLADKNPSLQDAAGRLLAALPLAGGTDRKTPTEIWNSGIQDILCMMNMLVEMVAPVGNRPSNREGFRFSAESSQVLQEWTSFLRQDISSDQDRAKTFVTMTRGLVLAYQHYLSPDLNGDAVLAFLEVKLDVESILEVVERFMSYPMTSESLFFRTKLRLRDVPLEGGLISPRIMATRVANELKCLGHEVLNILIQSVGGPALLPYARRIIRISYASLLTSCSAHVRKVMDPSSSGQLEGKKRRWLHLSVCLRTRAVESVRIVNVAFGSDHTAKIDSMKGKAESKSDGEMAITLVAGCLMEQIGAKDVEVSIEDNWGTLDERVSLITACLDCLRAALSSANGFLGLAVRPMIDSMVLTCLARNSMGSSGDPFLCSSVQSRILRLASTCLSTPWNDGASSSVARVLQNSALKVLHDGDDTMSLAAMEALRVCDLFGTPRAPALVFFHRTITENAERFECLAPQAIADIQKNQVQNKEARAAIEETEKTKQREKRLREKEKEQSSKLKRGVQETRDEPMLRIGLASKPATPESQAKPGDVPVDAAGAEEAQVNNQDMELDAGQLVLGDGAGEAEDESSDAAQSRDEEFPDFDIVADGPDSDDD